MSWRYRLTFLLVIFSFFLIIGKLFYWQVVKAEELSTLGQSQYEGKYTLLPKRGDIVASDGFPFATNKLSYLLFADPKDIKKYDKKTLPLILSQELSIDQATISALLNKDLFWIPIQSDISSTKKKRSIN